MQRDRIENWSRVDVGMPRVAVEIAEGDGVVSVNRERDGRRGLTYAEYLRLPELLSAQVPATNVPDERAFVITHQEMELAFRLCIFDLYVISKSLATLATADHGVCRHLCLYSGSLEDGGTEASFWRPARAASARLRLSAEVVVPALLAMLGRDGSPTFSTREFAEFRGAVEPASGFQSGQFRLIERAFGKGGLLALPVFPRDAYARHYGGQEPQAAPFGRVTDPSFYGAEGRGGLPDEPEVIGYVTSLEDHANAVLARLAQDEQGEPTPPPCPLITPEQVSGAVAALERMFTRDPGPPREGAPSRPKVVTPGAAAAFAQALKEVASAENRARSDLGRARRGAYALKIVAPSSALAEVLNGIIAADDSFFGQHSASFISEHQAVAVTRIRALQAMAAECGESAPTSGTGGGGPAYLAWRRTYLLPLFPALPAYRGLDEAEALSWVE